MGRASRSLGIAALLGAGLAIWGYAEPSLAFCDEAELVRIPDAGHWLLHEKPEEISRLLIDFFGEP